MRILAFDTATRATTVALVDPASQTAHEARDDPPPGTRPRHTSCLLPLIARVLDQAKCDWSGVDLIAVGTGPGTFTGLRIGVATARALAQARDIPLIGISTLESLTAGATSAAQEHECDTVLAVLDARRREVFAAAWTASSPPSPVLGPVAMSPSALADTLADIGHTRLAVGDGAVEFSAVLDRPGTVVPGAGSRLHLVSAVHHGHLAAQRQPTRTEDVRPEYLRVPDAELSLRAAPPR
jgi:tRNA threonylcarbamoyladenosine biosynthesis protein TsaB